MAGSSVTAIDGKANDMTADPDLLIEEAPDVETGLEDVLELNFLFAHSSAATKTAELECINAAPVSSLRESLARREQYVSSLATIQC